jgi:hypothetical protein
MLGRPRIEGETKMTSIQVVYFLVAILHGGPNDPFSLTRLAAFPSVSACETAARTTLGALEGANKDETGRVEIGCIGSDKLDAMKRR